MMDKSVNYDESYQAGEDETCLAEINVDTFEEILGGTVEGLKARY